MYLHSVPVMKAVISADIILEPRNIVIYYSPLIKAVISLPIPLFSSLPLKPFPPLPSPPSPTYHFILLSYPLVNFLHDPSQMPFALSFCPSLLSCYFPLCLSLFALLSCLSPCTFFFSLSFSSHCFISCLYYPLWFNK